MSWQLMTWLLTVALKNAILVLPLAALAMLAARWWRRPALAHVLWAIALLKLLTPPLVDVPVGWKLNVEKWLGQVGGETLRSNGAPHSAWQAPDVGSRAAAVAPRAADMAPGNATTPPATTETVSASRRARMAALPPPRSTWSISWTQVAIGVWIAGSLVMLTVLARRAWRFRRFMHWAVQRDEFIGVRVAELSHMAGVIVPPKVFVVDGIVSPMLWGLGSGARLIFPAQLAKRLSPAELDTLLLHELAHFARRDHWLRALEMAACVLYWWNPLVWWARREIERAEEECCDAWVVERQTGQRRSYAEALLAAVDFLSERREVLPPVACGLGEVALLRLRLIQIMNGETTARLSRRGQTLLLTAGLLLSPLEPALWATSAPVPRAVRTASTDSAAKSDDGAITSGGGEQAAVSMSGSALPVGPLTPTEPSRAISSSSVSPPQPSVVLWAAAVSPDGKFRLEARTGRRARLIRAGSDWQLNLSSYEITCVTFAPDGKTFVTGHGDAAVRLWDSQTGGIIRSLKGSEAGITSVHVSPDGRGIAAGSSDGGVIVWDLATGEETARLPPQETSVSCLRWSKRGDRLAIALGSWSQPDETALLFWAPGKTVTRRGLEGPIGALDWLGEDESLIIAAWSGQCQVWSVAAGKATGGLVVEKDQVSAAAWSADCPLISKWLADQLVGRARE